MNNFKKRALLAVLAVSLSVSSASGLDIIVSDGDKFNLDISQDFPTRLSFKNDVGKQFIFNKSEGDGSPVVSTIVGQSGDVFVSVIKGRSGDVLGGYITTSQGYTYPVDITISDKRQDHLVVLNLELESKISEAKALKESKTFETQESVKLTSKHVTQWSSHTGHYQALSQLMRSIYHEYGFAGFYSSKNGSGVHLGKSVSERVEYSLSNGRKTGQKIALTNVSGQVLYMPELLKGRKDIIAASFGDETLEPGKSTYLYVVTRGRS